MRRLLKMDGVEREMASGVERGVYPGAILLVSKGREILFHRAYGVSNLFTGKAMGVDTVFDLASLTKPLSTALALMKLTEQGSVTLETTLASLLPEFEHTEKRAITIVQLLTHQSGYPAYRPFYRTLCKLPFETRNVCLKSLLVAQPLSETPGRRTIYSDLGYLILQWVVERMSGRPLDGFLQERVYGPLAVDSLFFPGRKGISPEESVAATECCPRRNLMLSGRVHDDNADVLGGVAGHAGLFGTARGVHQVLCHLLDTYLGRAESPVFRPDLVHLFCTPWGAGGRPPGFDRPEGTNSSAGRHFSENTVGHLGFTGTSFWMDLKREVIVVLLTNRVHPSRANLAIRWFRPRLHDAVMEAVLSEKSRHQK